ncbi:site-specific DNA-methyltransferase [Apibacter muscae]|uniref:site-specific DNA-methyltransferase n=1 Tax=Apibacter muscae TaxID=2509004 RepID=UPI0011AB97E4|nr:site-specific DNA-methyltransferase [Apibacter muscae]TWP24244.1 site-specific DNA-methyltransferase [Apibacter muscae]
MQEFNFNQHITQLLKADNRLVDEENDIQINVLRDLVNNLDSQLVELLIADDKVREKFFIQVKDVYVFKQNDFIFYLDSKVLDGSYTQYANRIGLASGGKFLTDSTDYVLDFPYKGCVLEGGQSTEEGNDVYFEYNEEAIDYVEKTAKRKEIFYNNIIAKDEIDRLLEPKAFQKVVRYDGNGETIPSSFTRDAELNRQRGLPEDTITDNLIIKGNNLLALHSLEKEFKGKVKLIYIDPPYNTEKDSFTYNDRFTHSTWLTFMRNRLLKAFDLLSDDGGIFVQADWNEIHYLKVLMDDVCGRDNFRNEIIWFYENKFKFQFTKNFNNDTEGILYYSKKSGFQKFKHVKVDVKNKRKQNQVTWDKELKKMVTVKDENGNVVYYESNDKIVGTLWNIPRINSQSKERLDLVGQKPEQLIRRILEACTEENDIVLDYHLGTGTTAATSHKMNRQYIGVEQLDYIESFTIARLNKVINNEDQSGISKDVNWQGGGSFVYAELAKNNETAKERIEACTNLDELLQLFEELNTRYFLDYNVRIKDFKENVVKEEAFINLSLARQKELFKRMLDNNQLYVNLSEVEDARYNLSEDAIRLTKDFYQIKN